MRRRARPGRGGNPVQSYRTLLKEMVPPTYTDGFERARKLPGGIEEVGETDWRSDERHLPVEVHSPSSWGPASAASGSASAGLTEGARPGCTLRATVRNPLCATLRRSGRTLRPSRFQVRSRVSNVWIIAKTCARCSASTVRITWGIVGT